MRLTAEQKQIVEDSLWVVNSVLQKHGVNDEDLRQSAILYMCNCVQRYDPSRNIKWTTYAYKNVYLFVKAELAKEYKRENTAIGTDFEEMVEYIDADSSLNSISLPYPLNLAVEGTLAMCSEEDKSIIVLKMKGFTIKEIAERIDKPQSFIRRRILKIREYAKGMRDEIQAGRAV